jgi:hypothetical protein
LKTLIVIIFVELFGFSFALAQKNHFFGVELEGGFSRLLSKSKVSQGWTTNSSKYTPNYYLSIIYESNKNDKFNFVSSLKFGSINDLVLIDNYYNPQYSRATIDKNRYIFYCPGTKYSVKSFTAFIDVNFGLFINRAIIDYKGELNESYSVSKSPHPYSKGLFNPIFFITGFTTAFGYNLIEKSKFKVGLFFKSSIYFYPNFISNTLSLRITSK